MAYESLDSKKKKGEAKKETERKKKDTTREKEIAKLEELMDYFYFSDLLILDFGFDFIMN